MTLCGANPRCHPWGSQMSFPPHSGAVIGVKLQPCLHFDLHPEASGKRARWNALDADRPGARGAQLGSGRTALCF